MATIASAETNEKIGRVRSTGFRMPLAAISYLQAVPLFVILGIFFILPIAMRGHPHWCRSRTATMPV